MSANERTGWRDEWLSNRHREWGFDCPAVDIDFLMVEYNHGFPVALIDYKYWNGSYIDENQASIKAMINLANLAKIPAAFSYYKYDKAGICIGFKVQGLNKHAGASYSNIIRMSERDYVAWLYDKRGNVAPNAVLDILSISIPNESDKDRIKMA